MAAFDFPNSPTVGQTVTGANGALYQWTGTYWAAVGAPGGTGGGGGGATAAPGLGSAPSISGTGVVGQTLTCNNGEWTNIPTGFTYQWTRNNVDIAGATSSTYVLQTPDGNTTLRCRIVASNGVGASAPYVTNSINVLPLFVFPTGMAAIYSTRLVVQGYAGACMKLRRLSDNTTLDVGFIGSNFDHAAARAFMAGTQAFVEAWYDQSGNGRHAVQTTTTPLDIRPSISLIGNQCYLTFEGAILTTASPIALTGDQTIGYVGWNGSGSQQQIIVSDFDTANGWMVGINQGSSKRLDYFSNVGGYNGATSGNVNAVAPMRTQVTRTAGAVQPYLNGSTVLFPAITAGNGTPTVGMSIGGFNGNQIFFQGALSEVYIYGSALTPTQLSQIDIDESVYWKDLGFTTPYAPGCGVVQIDNDDTFTFGNVLQYDQGQAWTVWGAVQAYGYCTNAEVLFTNATPDSRAVCYELWIDLNGNLRVRLIHDYSTNLYLGVIGTVSATLLDGGRHMIGATYDGTVPATMSNIQLYADGVQLPKTLEVSNLGSLSITDPLQNYAVGMQMPGGANMRGPLSFFQQDKVARSAAYMANYHPGSATLLPPNDAVNTVMRLRFTEGSGLTTHDESASGFTGTFSNAGVWVP